MITLNLKRCFVFGILLHLIDNLTSLTELGIHGCPELTSLPEEIYSLEKLQTFYFCDYPHLEERYNKETGEDRAKIDHLPRIYFEKDFPMRYKVRNP